MIVKEDMTREEWLRQRIVLYKLLENLTDYDEEIKACPETYSIHIYSGIELLAEDCEIELLSKPFNVEESVYKIEYYFFFDGMKVFQIEKE